MREAEKLLYTFFFYEFLCVSEIEDCAVSEREAEKTFGYIFCLVVVVEEVEMVSGGGGGGCHRDVGGGGGGGGGAWVPAAAPWFRAARTPKFRLVWRNQTHTALHPG